MIYSPPVRIISLLVSKLYNTTMEVVRFSPVFGLQVWGVPLTPYTPTSMGMFSYVFPIISDGRDQKHFMNKQEFLY